MCVCVCACMYVWDREREGVSECGGGESGGRCGKDNEEGE